jgi:hypothetical protein
MLETKSIFDRSEVSGAVISDRAYNLTIGVVLTSWLSVFQRTSFSILSVAPNFYIEAIPFRHPLSISLN